MMPDLSETFHSADHPFLDSLSSPHFCGFPFISLVAPLMWLPLIQSALEFWILEVCFWVFYCFLKLYFLLTFLSLPFLPSPFPGNLKCSHRFKYYVNAEHSKFILPGQTTLLSSRFTYLHLIFFYLDVVQSFKLSMSKITLVSFQLTTPPMFPLPS